MKRLAKTLPLVVALTGFAGVASAQTSTGAPWCASGKPVRFAEIGWDSGKFETEIIRALVERGFGCKTETVPGANPITQAAVQSGNIQFWVEYWQGRTEAVETAAKEGKIKLVGSLIKGGGVEGIYVPEYVIKGDAAAGIKPMAPDLKSVTDLPKYKTLFKDDEDPSMGRFYNCPTGWSCEKDNNQRMKAYGLKSSFTNFRPGTGAALDSAITSAFQRHKPIVFSYWAPSSILGKFKAIRLEEPAWNEKCWKTINGSTVDDPCGSASPATNLTTEISAEFAKSDPDIVTLVSKVNLPLHDVNVAIAEMADKKIPAADEALSYLKQHPEMWKAWLPPQQAARFEASLK
ncbi:MAG: histidine ABC transporter substrate-binding protein [Burkholderiales bacterium]|nr:histidine ABC transporter substrate-binding protein [Burkholderiales bacterium]MDE2455340.1 histidine ABC transporter substrate-binding protein [Burkholderiales bacterium]